MKKKSIRTQLNQFILLTIFLLVSIGCTVALRIFVSTYETSVGRSLEISAESINEIFVKDNELELEELVEQLSLISDLQLNQNTKMNSLGWERFAVANKSKGIDFVQVWDKDTLLYEKNEQTVFAQYKNVPKKKMNSFEILFQEKTGIWMVITSPWLDEAGIQKGYIRIGKQLATQKFVEKVKQMTGYGATVFVQDIREVSTFDPMDGSSYIGTQLDQSIAKVVFETRETYVVKTMLEGTPHFGVYIPIFDSKGNIAGIIGIGESMEELYQVRNYLLISISVLGAILMMIFYTISKYWLKKNISNPILEAADRLEQVSLEQFVECAPPPIVKSQEFEKLHQSISTMAASISHKKIVLEQLAYEDPLTGLPNKLQLFKRYQKQNNKPNVQNVFVIYYLDMDNLKYINHLFGTQIGDGVLVEVATKLKQFCETSFGCQVYRVAGDEFVLCDIGVSSEDEIAISVEYLLTIFKQRFQVGDNKIHATASIGVAVYSGQESFQELYEKAEISMNACKKNGKNAAMLYTNELNEQLEKKARMHQEIRSALKLGDIFLSYQPKYNLKEQKFDSFEALIRWKHPGRGMVPPLEFIQVAEESNLIHEVGNFVLNEACAFIRQFNQTYHTQFQVAVNISAVQLMEEGFEEKVMEVLKIYGISPKELELELTETVFIDSFQEVTNKLNKLRDLGISIALDDFGTGYSSLNYLKTLPITTLKIDKSFSDDIAIDAVALEIVESVVHIAKSTGLHIVAEGIETKEQLDLLIPLGVDHIQGYYYAKPMLPEDMDGCCIIKQSTVEETNP